MSDQKNRYFIAVIPPSIISDNIIDIKEHLRQTYHSKAALNSPPHITLHMPFEWRADREEKLIGELTSFTSSFSIMKIVLNGFGCFEPRVLFIRVNESPDLNKLQKQLGAFCRKTLGLFNADYKDLPFHPHITVAFRDLKKPAFYKAWSEFESKSFEGTFDAESIYLLRQEDKRWNILAALPLKQ